MVKMELTYFGRLQHVIEQKLGSMERRGVFILTKINVVHPSFVDVNSTHVIHMKPYTSFLQKWIQLL
jgi:hypothetical protein